MTVLRRDPRPGFDGRPVVSSDRERAGSVVRVHGEADGWPEHVVVALGDGDQV